MQIDNLKKLFEQLHQDDFTLIYKGSVSDDITQKMVQLSEFNIKRRDELKKLKKKVPIVMVECFQNIIKHKKEFEDKDTSTDDEQEDFAATRNVDNNYYITSANLIENKNIDYLKEQLQKINQLSEDELKALYLEVLAEGEMSERGGAGLGLIEIAKKSGNELTYDFEKIDERLSRFYLGVKLMTDAPSNTTAPLTQSKDLYNHMEEEGINMIFKGDFSKKSIMPILNMIEKNVEEETEETTYQKRLMWVLVELLQNISKHAKKHNGVREGIFLLGKQGDQYTVSGGNYIDAADIDEIKDDIEKINSKDADELKSLYKKQLMEGETTQKGGAGLGLIDIARNSEDQKISYTVEETIEDKIFLGLQVVV